MNIFSNLIPSKVILSEMEVKLKHNFYHRHLRHERNHEDFAKLEDLRNEIDNLISKSMKQYYQIINGKPNDP